MRVQRATLIVLLIVVAALSVRHYAHHGGSPVSRGTDQMLPEAATPELPSSASQIRAVPSVRDTIPLLLVNATESAPQARNEISEAKFSALTQNLLSRLPTNLEIRKLTAAELHDTPARVVQGGRSIGRVAELIAHQPTLRRAGAVFYIQCASARDSVPALRALCYGHLKQLADSVGLGAQAVRELVPQNISDLAEQLPQHI